MQSKSANSRKTGSSASNHLARPRAPQVVTISVLLTTPIDSDRPALLATARALRPQGARLANQTHFHTILDLKLHCIYN